jgi:antibiotic biosynthesis monooxygenase (ABM) superfamily enzyme
VARYLASARRSVGHVSARESVQGSAELDWAIEVSFGDVNLLDTWLDSAERRAVLSEGQANGCWQRSVDLVLANGEPPPANAGIFLHSVAPGKEAEFVAAKSDLTRSSSAFRGYEAPQCVRPIPPASGRRYFGFVRRISWRRGCGHRNAKKHCHACAAN